MTSLLKVFMKWVSARCLEVAGLVGAGGGGLVTHPTGDISTPVPPRMNSGLILASRRHWKAKTISKRKNMVAKACTYVELQCIHSITQASFRLQFIGSVLLLNLHWLSPFMLQFPLAVVKVWEGPMNPVSVNNLLSWREMEILVFFFF